MEQPRDSIPDALRHERELMTRVRQLLEGPQPQSALPHFLEVHPADQAQLLSEIDLARRQALLELLHPDQAALVLEQMHPEEAAEAVGAMWPGTLSAILDEAGPDVAADILKRLPEEQSLQTLQGMGEVEDVAPLLEYADDTAGGIMTTEYVSVRADTTAAIALDILRVRAEGRVRGEGVDDVGSLLVVDDSRRLVGSLGVTRLALARPTLLVADIMDPEVRHVAPDTDQEECASLAERYDLSYLPVVDEERRLLGVILVQDLVDVIEEEATEDMYHMARIGPERLFGSPLGSVRRRLPWLYLNLATTILAALVINFFESTVARVVALAMFLPVVAGQGGIGGTQTLTLVIRGIALGDLPGRRALPLLGRELVLGLIHGVLLGAVIGVVAFLWKGNGMLGVVVGLAVGANMVIAGMVGAATPLVLRALRMDPALGAAVVVTTVADVVGFLIFLGIAASLISTLD